ncbi:Transposon Tf2-6 poly, partial [Paramuricea clavata]
MDKHVEAHVKCCHPCQLVAQPPRPEPMRPTELPKEPWTELAIDICGPFPTGEYIVVLTDYYSRWPEAKTLKTVTPATILKWLNSIFAQHGYPTVLKSDNASYFTSTQFKTTLQSWGVQHKTVTEYWPQANGQVERFNEVIKKH